MSEDRGRSRKDEDRSERPQSPENKQKDNAVSKNDERSGRDRERDDSRSRQTRRHRSRSDSRSRRSRRSESRRRSSRRSRSRDRRYKRDDSPLKSNKFWDGFQWVDRTPLVASSLLSDPSKLDKITSSDGNIDPELATTSVIASSIGQKDRRIYVGNLPAGVSTDAIRDFSKYSTLIIIIILLLTISLLLCSQQCLNFM